MDQSVPTKRPLRYRVDRLIRTLVMRVISGLACGSQAQELDLRGYAVKRILLVRANFRIGNAVLALPAIAAFHKKHSQARIDFVGSPISRLLLENQPLAEHFETPRRFPRVLWEYVLLFRRLRANRYDLAVDISCSQSGLASFIIGLCGARVRAGCAGKWDRPFNLKVAKFAEVNKYRKLTKFLTALGLDDVDDVGSLKFSSAELSAGRAAIDSAVGKVAAPVIGVFVGGRKLRGKRWPIKNFVGVIDGLSRQGYGVIAFLGPEEADIAGELKRNLPPDTPIICEPSLRKFAAMVSQLDLFVCCDSGPMHLACTVGVRVLAIFRARDVARWAPPAHAARIVCGAESVSAAEVLSAALEELSLRSEPPIMPSAGALAQAGQP